MSTTNVSLAQVQSNDRTINQLQQNIGLVVTQLQNQILNIPSNGIFITTTLVAGNNIINQNLQRVPQGYMITDIDAAATIYRVNYAKFTVTLNSSAPTTITMYLF